MHAKAVLNKDGSSRSDLQILSDQDWQNFCGTDSWNEIRMIQHPGLMLPLLVRTALACVSASHLAPQIS